MMIFLTKTTGETIALNKAAILMMEPTAQGTKITTSIRDDHYNGIGSNLIIEVRDKFTDLCFIS